MQRVKNTIIETDIEPFDLYNADEAFVSTTLLVCYRYGLNGLKIGSGKGKIFNKILNFGVKK